MHKFMSEEIIATPEQERHLDLLLAEWGQRYQISAATAEQIRQNAISGTEELPEEWWIQFGQSMKQARFDATQLQKQMMSIVRINTQTLRNKKGRAPFWETP